MKRSLSLLALGLIALLTWLLFDRTRPADSLTGPLPKAPPPIPTPSAPPDPPRQEALSTDELTSEAAEEARCKEIDMANMQKLHAGIHGFLKKYGRYPDALSELVPEFVSKETLVSPRQKRDQSNAYFAAEHADPGMAEPSYAFEFSNLEFRDGRTFAEIKEVQRAEWGDVVPLLRSFAYDKVINMSWRGDIYETQLNWEWDVATLKLAEKYGWGPGLTEGPTVRVQVLQPDGTPAAGADVWAGGRNFSFDLPQRPYPADADGWATIPVGEDVDRTALSLRAVMPGHSSEILRAPVGEVPITASLTLAPTVTLRGTVADSTGQPRSGVHVFLSQASTSPGGEPTSFMPTQPFAHAPTDAHGRWQIDVPASVADQLAFNLAEPAGQPFKYVGTMPLDAAAARAGTAVLTAPSPVTPGR